MDEPNNPFLRMRGLVGGDGQIRAEHRLAPLWTHRTVLHPWDVPDDREAARAFCRVGELVHYAGAAPRTPDLMGGHPARSSDQPDGLIARREDLLSLEVEIGFGRPHFIRERIAQAPDRRFLAFEIKREWCEQLAGFLDRQKLDNTRIFLADARPLIADLLAPGCLVAAYVFFPDPWWKKRHEKRRVVSPELFDVLAVALRPGGAIEFRTDVLEYFSRVEAMVAEDARFERGEPGIDDQGRVLPLSHREKKCAEVGAAVHRMRLVRRA